mmetsp:Transcript_175175/g.556425  ORF Transcript_175175/g.556425 Transcript_175175/m.556425 type:complete len:116 (+) Transcript_175175:232-579(+)
MVVQLWLRPWKGTLVNMIDAVASSSLVAMLMVASVKTNMEKSAGPIDFLGVGIIACFALCCFGAIGSGVKEFIAPTPQHSWVVCHDRWAAGAQARFMKQLLRERGQNTCLDGAPS